MPYNQLSLNERYVIYHCRLINLSAREISRRLGRSPSTISRELIRNAPMAGTVYYGPNAQHKADQRRKTPKHQKRSACLALKNRVMARLKRGWSPEQIAGRLKLDFPDDASMRVAPETLYGWIYRDYLSGGLLYKSLRRQHKRRRRQPRFSLSRHRIPGRISIHQRPPEAAERKRYGDWEGDTVHGAKGCGAVVTLVERRSRYLLAGWLPDKAANGVNVQTIRLMATLPKAWRRTLTFDNGGEFARFADIERNTGVKVFFADPYAAWQRGTNENTNGLLRQYFPKGCNFLKVSKSALAKAVLTINHRPRKCLGFISPHEIRKAASVAL